MMSQEQAVIQALVLALTAPTEEQHNRAMALVEQLSGGEPDDETFNRWLAEAKAQLASRG